MRLESGPRAAAGVIQIELFRATFFVILPPFYVYETGERGELIVIGDNGYFRFCCGDTSGEFMQLTLVVTVPLRPGDSTLDIWL